MKYNRQLMMAILHDKIKIAKAVNVTVVTLEEAVQGYKDFDKGAAKKFVLDPHGMVAAHNRTSKPTACSPKGLGFCLLECARRFLLYRRELEINLKNLTNHERNQS